MDGKKTGLIIGVVALVLCGLIGVVSLFVLGGAGFFLRNRVSSTTVTGPIAVATAAPKSAQAKGFALGGRALTDTTLSVFDTEPLICRWRRLDPVSGAKDDVAAIDGSCSGTRVSWNADGTKAILWLDPLEDGWKGTSGTNGDTGTGGDRVWLVTFASGTFDPLPRVSDGELMEVGFDASGHEVAISSDEISEAQVQAGTATYHGQSFKVDSSNDGLPILAHAFHLENGAWVPFETKVSEDGTDISEGVKALDAWKTLGVRTTQLLSGQPETSEITDAGLQKKLKAILSPDEESGGDGEDQEQSGSWRSLKTDAGPVYVWEEEAEGLYATGLIAFPNGSDVERAEKLDLTEGDAASPMTRGKYLLIAGQDGEQPHLYDVSTRKLIWSDENATGTVFWPK